MARIRDLLYRFRPASAPGGASASGVPADRAADAALELRAVFAQLSTTQDECREIVEAAHREAARLRDEAAGQEREISRNVPARARMERAQAASSVGENGRAEAEARSAAAHQSAEGLGHRAEQLMAQYVESVVVAAGIR